ncbi:MAG TPA: hypothetical protein VGB18_05975 [Candidatus Thermoplasmatota archaeon]
MIHISATPNFGYDPNGVFLTGIQETSTTIQDGLQPGFTYYWRVMATDQTDRHEQRVADNAPWTFSLAS